MHNHIKSYIHPLSRVTHDGAWIELKSNWKKNQSYHQEEKDWKIIVKYSNKDLLTNAFYLELSQNCKNGDVDLYLSMTEGESWQSITQTLIEKQYADDKNCRDNSVCFDTIIWLPDIQFLNNLLDTLCQAASLLSPIKEDIVKIAEPLLQEKSLSGWIPEKENEKTTYWNRKPGACIKSISHQPVSTPAGQFIMLGISLTQDDVPIIKKLEDAKATRPMGVGLNFSYDARNTFQLRHFLNTLSEIDSSVHHSLCSEISKQCSFLMSSEQKFSFLRGLSSKDGKDSSIHKMKEDSTYEPELLKTIFSFL